MSEPLDATFVAELRDLCVRRPGEGFLVASDVLLDIIDRMQTAESRPSPAWVVPVGYTPDGAGSCRSCSQAILWTKTAAGKRAPLNPDGTSHFATCPQAADWRKR